jgi:hypothetical protein
VGVLGLGALAVAWTLPSIQAGVTAPHDQTVMDVARAAGQSMLGPHAFVGSAWLAAWYTSGGHTVYSVDSDLLFLNNRLDMNRLRRYLSYFDAIAVPQWSSGLTWNAQHETPISWYVDGLLHLRGFYYDPSLHDTGSYLLLTARAGLPLVGYAVMDHAPYAFHERADGDYMFLTTVCAHGPISFGGPPLTGASFTFRLPSRERGVPARAVLEVMLVGRKEFQAQQAALRVACRIREATQGMLVPVSTPQMLAALSRDDKPIRFYETVADAVRYAIGIAVPPDVLPVVR